jgi:heme/copper-type cytochrome/quinol oxidase subunit 3
MGEKYRRQTLWALGLTVALGIFFSSLQFHEYYIASFTIAEGIYGSTFYMITGFHGVHVLVGTIFLTVVFFRTYYYHFCQHLHYFGFDAAVWY